MPKVHPEDPRITIRLEKCISLLCEAMIAEEIELSIIAFSLQESIPQPEQELIKVVAIEDLELMMLQQSLN
jgi:hypothetical protein